MILPLVLALVGGADLAVPTSRSLTCDPSRIAPASYALTTEAQGTLRHEPQGDWWKAFDLGRSAGEVQDLDRAALQAAQRASELDPGNLMAYSILARQALVLEEPEVAERAWRRVLDSGGAVVWSATLYGVDAHTYFFLAFSRDALRLYRMDQLAGEHVRRRFYGVPELPGPQAHRFYEGWAGCIDASLEPEAEIPWSDVEEIKAGNWLLWFRLRRPIQITSDRTLKRKSVSEVKVNLHGRTGELEVYKHEDQPILDVRGLAPAGFQDLVRQTLVRLVDPDRRISVPPLKAGSAH